MRWAAGGYGPHRSSEADHGVNDGRAGFPLSDRAAGPPVERIIAQVGTFCGRRLKLRYCGVTRNHT